MINSMWEDVEQKIKSKGKPQVRQLMQASLPQVRNALNPPAESMAVQARLHLASAHEEIMTIQQWASANPDRVEQQRHRFQEILDKVKKISQRVKKIR